MKRKPIFERKNVLVTGGAGFIGSHLCDELVKTAKVICIDNFLTGSEENINHLLKHPDFEFLNHDLSEPINLEDLPELKPFQIAFQGVQEIYHLACPTSPKEYNRYPIETLLANAHGTRNVLEIARKYESKLVHTSTSAIYGEPLENAAYPETYWGYIDPIGPRSCYNEGKRFAESLVVNYRQKFKLDLKIARIFNTFGPRMKLTDGRMIPDFVYNAMKGKDVVIYGEEGDTSTFCYISDMIEALLRLMKSHEQGPVNLGNPEVYPIGDVAQKVVEFVGTPAKLTYEPRLPFTARQGVPDISLAKEKLGWFPVVPLEEGLKRTIDYMKGMPAVTLDALRKE
ncbi:MAG: GDP-mannose 4,6-dehydratase [Candidatus Kerfeldbacteria bacterium]|nr:GDP-mannose 4,6-dehydratase [Candidatus Kerfeldbacteria bacterium]